MRLCRIRKEEMGPYARAVRARNSRTPAPEPPPKKPSALKPRGPGGTRILSLSAGKAQAKTPTPLCSDFLGHQALGELFQFSRIRVELPDSLAQLVHRHGVFVVLPAEGLLVQMQLLALALLGAFHGQGGLQFILFLVQLVQQIG